MDTFNDQKYRTCFQGEKLIFSQFLLFFWVQIFKPFTWAETIFLTHLQMFLTLDLQWIKNKHKKCWSSSINCNRFLFIIILQCSQHTFLFQIGRETNCAYSKTFSTQVFSSSHIIQCMVRIFTILQKFYHSSWESNFYHSSWDSNLASCKHFHKITQGPNIHISIKLLTLVYLWMWHLNFTFDY